jgi:hypothetical protein
MTGDIDARREDAGDGTSPSCSPNASRPSLVRRRVSASRPARLAPLDERHWERRLYWWSFVARFGVGLLGWIIAYFELFNLPLLQDSLYYEEVGASVANEWLAGRSSEWLSEAIDHGQGNWGLVVVIAAFYCLTGGLRLLPLLIAGYCTVTSWTPVLIYRIGRRLGAPLAGARNGAWLVALSPAFAFWSGALYKEGLVLVLLALVVYHVLILQETSDGRSLVIVALCMPALFAVRFYLATLLSLVLVLGLLLARGQPRSEGLGPTALLRQVVVILIVGTILFVIGFTDRIAQVLPDDVEQGLARIDSSRRDLASQPSGYLIDADVSTPTAALEFLPIGLTYFLAAPFPWQSGSLRQNLTIPETAFWVLLYPFLFLGLREAWHRHRQGALLIMLFTGMMCCFYGIYCGNIGVVYRMRVQVWVLWAPLIGWGWEVFRHKGSLHSA